MTALATKPLICTVFRASIAAELYIYVRREEALERVPSDLLAKLGNMSEVLTMKLTPDRKLARVKAVDVLAAIADKGFYLQLPPDFNPARFTMGGWMSNRPFWESKKLSEMTRPEWESLCDGCAKCCVHKLEDEDTGLVHYTSVVCRYLDQEKCKCTVYAERRKLVPTCLQLQPEELDQLHWMPSTCAYRLLHEGKGLPIWHPLITGNRKEMIRTGHTVTGKVISEDYVHEEDWQDHIVPWS